MKMRLIMFVIFLTAMTADFADAEWEYWNAAPQPFQVFDDYVIAIGARNKLESVEAADIYRALEDGREIRLRYAEVQGDLKFGGEIKRDVYFVATTFTGNADFREATFTGDTDFFDTTFTGDASFGSATFTGRADFSDVTFTGDAVFSSATFTGNAVFSSATFTGNAVFSSATFTGNADFRRATFAGYADFGPVAFARYSGSATFAGNAVFTDTTFTGNAVFIDTTFTGNADFSSATFTGDAGFSDVTFTGNAVFSSATFTGNAVFRRATFAGYANFGPVAFARYSGSATFAVDADFRSATFTGKVNFLGALKNISYDEVFYLTLIKTYKEQGWLNEADYAYYDYRQKKRKNRNILYGGAELVFLEIPFGYGVKPWKLLGSFIAIWLPFSLYYVGFLRRPENWFIGGIRPWIPFRDRFRCLGWALIHSLNILTPGIDLQSTRFMETSKYALVKAKSRRVVWVQRIQQILGWYLLALFLVMFGKIWVR